MTQPLTLAGLRSLAGEWIGAGKRVVAPVRQGRKLLYSFVTSADGIEVESATRPVNSIKEFIFPRHEELFHYRIQGNDVKLDDAPSALPAMIVIAARACDAAALPVLDKVFNWDYKDEFYNRRRAATTVVTVACTAFDADCFCTSTGIGPDSPAGSDAMIHPLPDGNFKVRCFTDKGRALFGEGTKDELPKTAAPQVQFDAKEVGAQLAAKFESPLWAQQAVACLGCGACAYTCPTCHCFDIVDEGNAAGGARVKNWDSCQFPLFTLHASGHNPRGNQGQRQRQRIFHKFRMYPEKFEAVLCTGCGNCARNCPAGLGMLRLIEALKAEAAR